MFDKASVESILGLLLEHRENRDLSIDFKQDTKILQTRLRLVGTEELAVICKFIEDSKAKGRIRESKSECVLPVLLVKKPGSSIRVYVDYRAVNEITIKNRYPLPYIRETIARISQAKFFTVLDIITVLWHSIVFVSRKVINRRQRLQLDTEYTSILLYYLG